METAGTARLTRAIPPQRAISASVSRREINAALHDTDGIPELTLDVIAVDRGERGTITMTWSRDELERLLEAAPENEVVLTFDEEQLMSSLGDVEAHGMRTGAAVFAVAAAGALGAGVAAADASITGGDGGGSAATQITATTGAAASASLARSEALNEQYGLGAAAGAAAADASLARSEALNEQYGLGAAAGAAAADASLARSEALNEQYGLGAAGGAAAAAGASQARSEALNEQYGLGSAGDAAATRAVEQRGAAMNEAFGLGASATDSSGTAASSGDGYAVPADDALLFGGLLLTIAGAAFVVRRSSTPPLA